MEGTIGEIRMFAGTFAPRGWQFCQGQLLAISQFSAVFAILGTTYGGDGRVTFGLPNLSSRVPVGTGAGPGLSEISLGEVGGTEIVSLTLSNMPIHNHSATAAITASTTPQCLAETGSGTTPVGQYPALSTAASFTGRGQSPDSNMGSSPVTASATITVNNNGGSQPFSNRNPFMGMNYVICLEGVFPSRN